MSLHLETLLALIIYIQQRHGAAATHEHRVRLALAHNIRYSLLQSMSDEDRTFPN